MLCPICHKECVVEQPPCADEHDVCPEWLCVECGAALFAGWLGSGSSSAEPAA